MTTDSLVHATTKSGISSSGISSSAGQQEPLLRVLSGSPTPAETAALTVIISQLSRQAADGNRRGPRNDWGSPEDKLRKPLSYSPMSFHNVSFY